MNKNKNKYKKPTKETFYFPHLREEDLQKGIESQRYHVGTLRILIKSAKFAFVTVPAFSSDIVIHDLKDRNRAFHGDLVVIELYPSTEWPPANQSLPIIEKKMPSLESLSIEDNNSQQLWRPRADLLIPFEATEREGEVEEKEAAVPEKNSHKQDIAGLQPKGRVVGILKQSVHRAIVGSINLNGRDPTKSLHDRGAFVTFIPSDARYPHLIVTKSHLPDEFLANPLEMSTSTIFLADIAPVWTADSKLATGENLRAVGQVGDIASETEALLIENGLNHSPYSDEILEPLMEFLQASHGVGSSADGNWTIPTEELAKRRDLRFNRRIFTIDPPNARDLDDALHITPLPSGDGKQLYEVGVHIADVAHFVVPNTPLDLEARNRATSVYLVQKVIPMLPRILCEQLCSLNPNVDRLAFSVIFVLTEDGDLAEGHVPWYGRTVIQSCAKLDYGTAQRIVDGEITSYANNGSEIQEELWESARRPTYRPPSTEDNESETSTVSLSCADVANDVCLLHRVAMSRRKKRLANGALVLTRPKITFRLDSNGNPISTQPYPMKESNQLIEEYMLLGNYLVAEKLLETVGPYAFLRHHPPPDTEGLDLLVHLVSTLGHDLDTSSSSSLQRSLSQIQSTTSNEAVLQVITSLLMKPMNRAKYMIAGENKNPSPSSPPSSLSPLLRWRHYALAIPYYTHFTSPIRRYADVMVHRLLEEGLRRESEGLGRESDGQSGKGTLIKRMDELVEIASHCNTQKEASKTAQDRSDVVFLSVYLMRSPQVTEGIVVGMAEKSFTVLILPFSLEARIYIDKIGVVDRGGGGGRDREDSPVTGSYDVENKVLTLVNSKPSTGPSSAGGRCGNIAFTSMQLRLMSPVAVYLSADTSPPISVRVDFLGPVP
jgi:DIS3-like exonuclease 2